MQGLHDAGMKLQIEVDQILDALAVRRHSAVERRLDFRDVLRVGAHRGESSRRGLHRQADFAEIAQETRIGVLFRLPGQNIGVEQIPVRTGQRTHTAARANLDHPLVGEHLQRFPQDGAADAELLAQAVLVRKYDLHALLVGPDHLAAKGPRHADMKGFRGRIRSKQSASNRRILFPCASFSPYCVDQSPADAEARESRVMVFRHYHDRPAPSAVTRATSQLAKTYVGDIRLTTFSPLILSHVQTVRQAAGGSPHAVIPGLYGMILARKSKGAEATVREALATGVDPAALIADTAIPPWTAGMLFGEEKCFVPELLLSGRMRAR